MARTPFTPDFSIITCSIDEAKYQAFLESAQPVFGKSGEFIRINDAKSLNEGYERGLDLAQAENIILCHDDIELVNPELPEILMDDLSHFDLVGVAGTTRLISGNWTSAGYPYLHGHIIHRKPGGESCSYLQYGCGRDEWIVGEMQALDGVFIACKRTVLEDVGFDSKRFNGFHLYDLDLTFSAFLKGYRLAVDHRIQLMHFSGGVFDRTWKKYALRFNRKHGRSFDPVPVDNPVLFFNRLDGLEPAQARAMIQHIEQSCHLALKKNKWTCKRPNGETTQFSQLNQVTCLPDFIELDQPMSHKELSPLLGRRPLIVIHSDWSPKDIWSAMAHLDWTPVASSAEDRGPGTLILRSGQGN